jgi:hypothetical protein
LCDCGKLLNNFGNAVKGGDIVMNPLGICQNYWSRSQKQRDTLITELGTGDTDPSSWAETTNISLNTSDLTGRFCRERGLPVFLNIYRQVLMDLKYPNMQTY